MKSPLRKFVVDADIAQAAGPDPQLRPWPVIAKDAHDVLHAIRECAQYVILFDPTLLSEWRIHAGNTGTRWLADMASKGRIKRITSLNTEWIEPLIQELPAHDRPTATKDQHLVVLACDHGDRRVLSCDEKAREKFARLAEARELEGLHWAKPHAELVSWLKDGAEDSEAYTLM